jgi:putative ABC transport system ATP-binding protein
LIDLPTSGSYRLNNHPIDQLDVYQRAALRNKEIGFIFQSFNLIGSLTVLENVLLPFKFSESPPKNENELGISALKKVGMDNRANHYPSQLSGGQQQRVSVARSIINNPSLLLADEPTGNLDTYHGELIMELVDQLHVEGVTICTVTHDERFAKRASRQILLKDGQIQ